MSTTIEPPTTPAAAAPPPKKRAPKLPGIVRKEVVERLNDHHAVILLGDRPAVLREGTGPDGRDEIRLLSVGGFHEWTKPDIVWLGDGADAPVRKVQASKLWIEDERRRQYDGLVFDPAGSAPKGYYNLWRGWAVEPAPSGSSASCQRFIDHVANNVCSGNPEHFAWVMGWFAALVQRPTEKLGTSLVLRGGQGTGKTIVGTVIGSLLGQHYALVSDPQRLVGRFNSPLANCLLLQLDEATWGGNHEAAGKLKDLVTGEWQFIEYKGREPVKVRNYVRLLITGNNRWLVPAGVDERRFAVFDMGDEKQQNSAYFQAIEDEMNAGGREALLRYLLDYDLRDIPLRSIPATAALSEQKVSSLQPEEQWWLDILMRGTLPGDYTGEGQTETSVLYQHYLTTAQKAGVNRKSYETQLGYALRGMVPELRKFRRTVASPSGPERHYMYEFPPLAECRKAFDRILGDDHGWDDDADRSAVAEWQPERRL